MNVDATALVRSREASMRLATAIFAAADAEERAAFIAAILAQPNVAVLAAAGSGIVLGVVEVAKTDPRGAGRVAAAIMATFATHRPESPAPLDADFAPTEPVPSGPPGG